MPVNQFAHSMPNREFIVAGSPTAFFAESCTTEQCDTDCAIGTTSLFTGSLVYLYAGDTVTSIGFCVAGTAGATVTHRLMGLYSTATIPAFLAGSADSTTATLAANTVFSQALTAPFTIVTSGAYWIGAQISHGGTQPSLIGRTCGLNVTATAAINALLAGSRTNGLAVTATGGSSTLPTTLASLTQLSVQPWFFCV